MRTRSSLAVAFAVLVGALLVGQPAACVYCPTFQCYAPCNERCACMVPPGEVGGMCVSFRNAPQGWSVLP